MMSSPIPVIPVPMEPSQSNRLILPVSRPITPVVSNLHRGGMATVAQISDEERAIAIKATQTLGLDAAGVDILRAARGPLVMEVNASPGLEGVETTTGVDVAGKMIAWIERQATPEFCLKIGG